MKSPARMPVKAEQFLLNAIGISWPHIQNTDIRFHLNVLAEQLQQELDKKMGRRIAREKKEVAVENTENEDVRKFIALFRDRYAQETDMEYRTKLNPEELGAIKAIVKKLRDKKVGIDDYLGWVFDVFFDDPEHREKFAPPMVKFVCGTFLASKYFMNNRDTFRKRRIAEEKKSRRESIRDYAKKLFRQTKDLEIQRMLKKEYDGTITAEYLENWVREKEKSIKEVNINE